MKKSNYLILRIPFFFAMLLFFSCNQLDEQTKKELKKQGKKTAKEILGSINNSAATQQFIFYTVNLKKAEIQLFLKNNQDSTIGSLGNLKNHCDANHQKLLFACNGGMYMENQMPLGWFVQNGKEITKLNTKKGKGNFYLKPNGVFVITKNNIPTVTTNANAIEYKGNVKYATQSGPMLVHDGKINTLFDRSSSNLNIRNGVGIDSNGNVVFCMSAQPINFYDFASFYVQHGCKEALYLDGFVSRFYAPSENFIQTDGQFGVLIGVLEK